MAKDYSEVLFVTDVDGPAITAASRTLALTPPQLPLPAGFFNRIGQMFELEASGRISNAVTTPGTARFDIAFGGTAIMDGLAVPLNLVAKTNVHWRLRIWAKLVAKGASANFKWHGEFKSEAVVGSPLPSAGGSGEILLPYNTASAVSANFDSAASQLVGLYFTQTVATGSLTVEHCKFSNPY